MENNVFWITLPLTSTRKDQFQMTAYRASVCKPRLSDDLCSNNFHRRIRRLIHLTSLHEYPVIKDLPVAAENEAWEGFISKERGAMQSLWSPSQTVDGSSPWCSAGRDSLQITSATTADRRRWDVELSVERSGFGIFTGFADDTWERPRGGESRYDAAVLVTAQGYATLGSVIQGGV